MRRPEYAVRLSRLAEEDFNEIISYVAAERPTAAEELADRIEKNLKLLAQNPRLGRVPSEQQLVRLGYRYLIVENYLVFYTIDGTTIFVHRIVHGARDYLTIL